MAVLPQARSSMRTLGLVSRTLRCEGRTEVLSVAIGFKHGEYIGFVEASDALESGDGRAHLAAFEGAEKSDGNVRGAGDLGERKSALDAQAAKALAGGCGERRRAP